MTVLAIDTSSREGALVMRVSPAGRPLALREVGGGRLDIELRAALEELLGEGVEAVVVLTGPGSYTGVRGGMAAALGLASAAGLPLHGIGTLAAVAAAAVEVTGGVLAVADAGRGGVHVAGYVLREGVLAAVAGHHLRRVTATDLDGAGLPLVAARPVPGLSARLVGAPAALAAAVPHALLTPRLAGVGLSATHP